MLRTGSTDWVRSVDEPRGACFRSFCPKGRSSGGNVADHSGLQAVLEDEAFGTGNDAVESGRRDLMMIQELEVKVRRRTFFRICELHSFEFGLATRRRAAVPCTALPLTASTSLPITTTHTHLALYQTRPKSALCSKIPRFNSLRFSVFTFQFVGPEVAGSTEQMVAW